MEWNEIVVDLAIGAIGVFVGWLVFAGKTGFGEFARRIAASRFSEEDIKKDVETSKRRAEEEFKINMRSVAIEKRLEVYQQAFALALDLNRSMHHEGDPEKASVIQSAEEWWKNNNLYLDEKSDRAFVQTIRAVRDHPTMLSIVRQYERGSVERQMATDDVIKNGKLIRSLPNVLRQQAGMPSFSLSSFPDIEAPTSPEEYDATTQSSS